MNEDNRVPKLNRVFGLEPEDERLLDLLVDDELSAAERRELLTRLDERPEGWRRCALAFLEAQAWRGDLGTLQRSALKSIPVTAGGSTGDTSAGDDGGAQVTPAATAESYRGRRLWFLPQSYYSLAAGLMIAFVLGLTIRDHLPSRGTGNVPRGDLGGPAANGSFAQGGSGGNAADRFAGALTLDASDSRKLEVPVYAGPGYDETWMRNQPSAFPDDLRRSLQQRGIRIQQNRRFMPVDLEDGRRVIVPVESVELRTDREYQ